MESAWRRPGASSDGSGAGFPALWGRRCPHPNTQVRPSSTLFLHSAPGASACRTERRNESFRIPKGPGHRPQGGLQAGAGGGGQPVLHTLRVGAGRRERARAVRGRVHLHRHQQVRWPRWRGSRWNEVKPTFSWPTPLTRVCRTPGNCSNVHPGGFFIRVSFFPANIFCHRCVKCRILLCTAAPPVPPPLGHVGSPGPGARKLNNSGSQAEAGQADR